MRRRLQERTRGIVDQDTASSQGDSDVHPISVHETHHALLDRSRVGAIIMDRASASRMKTYPTEVSLHTTPFVDIVSRGSQRVGIVMLSI